MRDIADDTGALVNQITYDSFGNILSQTNAAAGDRFTYTGREYDSELELYYYRARYYDPQLGRFISEDPISFAAGDSNLYRYAINTPLLYTDPSGHLVYGWAFNFNFTFGLGGQFTLYRVYDSAGNAAWIMGGSGRVGLQGDLSVGRVLSQGNLKEFADGGSLDVSGGLTVGVGGNVGYNTSAGAGYTAGVGLGGGASVGYGGSKVLTIDNPYVTPPMNPNPPKPVPDPPKPGVPGGAKKKS